MNSRWGGGPDDIFLVISPLGRRSGTGYDFTLGMPWLQRFYTVYDATNSEFSIANTPYTFADTN